MEITAKELAILFHKTYEKLAPDHGYETREETKQFDEFSRNGELMIATCEEILPFLRYGEDDEFATYTRCQVCGAMHGKED